MTINLNKVDFYFDKRKVLSDVSLDITSESTGFLGPNGSGKTTLLKIFSGLLKIKHGEIDVNNKGIKNYSSNDLAKLFAFVSQDYEPTFGFSVEEVIEMGRYPYLNKFGFMNTDDNKVIDKIIELLSLNSLRKIHTDELSSGEKQKVRFARALVQEPKYILLDEPTSNLDLSNKILILDVIKDIISFGTTLIITSHDLNFIKESTKQCFMISDGVIQKSGKTKDILNQSNIEKLYKLDSLPDWVL
ncbi:MAG: ABC transporter ATP-binding protein [Dehalococcoidia bacterium]|nr:ABC transporter ATP-binding protein [Dehalococcoidia bacterium]